MCHEGDKFYLTMQRIPGTQLGVLWPGLSNCEKDHIMVHLQPIWTYLRSIRALPSFIGGISGGPLQHRFFQVVGNDPSVTGPFYNEADIGRVLVRHSLKNWEANNTRPKTPESFMRHLPLALSGHGPNGVLTHADPQRKNILMKPLSEDVPGPDGWLSRERQFRISALPDWEDAGRYPSYWEYAAVFVDLQWNDDWPEKIEHMLDPCVFEAALLKIVRQDLDH